MPISVITNFKVNTYQPIDTRLVATNSAALSEIEFPYDGLTVYTKEQNLNYTYTGDVSGWQVSSNGIYGGSGSIVGDTDINMGSVGSITNDKSYELILSASSSQDRVQYATSFIRNALTDNYDTIEVKNQVRFLDNTLGLKNGPYISYNKNDSKKGIISFGTPDRNILTTVERFRIEPDSTSNNGAIVMVPSTYSLPMYFSQKTSGEMFIGYNWNGTDKITSGTGSSIISFKNTGEILFSNILSTSPQIPITQMVIGEEDVTKASSVKFRVDSSARDMGATSILRSVELKTIPEIVRELEHKYTRLQAWGYSVPTQYIDQGTPKTIQSLLVSERILYIKGDGNFFDVELPLNIPPGRGEISSADPNLINDIRIVRDGINLASADKNDLPDGTEVTIRFTYPRDPYEQGFFFGARINLYQTSTQTTRKIKSSYADTIGGDFITILHNVTSTDATYKNEKVYGDVITFRRGGGYWYVTNIRREKQIIESLQGNALTWYPIDDSDGGNAVIISAPNIDLSLKRLSITYTDLTTTYKWIDMTGSLEYGTIDNPFYYGYTEAATDVSTFIEANTFRISKDNFGTVRVKGSFKITGIPLTNLINNHLGGGAINQIYFAKLLNSSWSPSLSSGGNAYTSWGYCEVIVKSNNGNGMPNSKPSTIPGKIRITPGAFASPTNGGRIILSFSLTNFPNPLAGTYQIHVNVPEFSYPTN